MICMTEGFHSTTALIYKTILNTSFENMIVEIFFFCWSSLLFFFNEMHILFETCGTICRTHFWKINSNFVKVLLPIAEAL